MALSFFASATTLILAPSLVVFVYWGFTKLL
jgi:hypothetical protein